MGSVEYLFVVIYEEETSLSTLELYREGGIEDGPYQLALYAQTREDATKRANALFTSDHKILSTGRYEQGATIDGTFYPGQRNV